MDAVRMPDFDESALCSQIGDVEMFIPVKGASVAIPKQVCRMCPWIDKCLEYALAVDVYGVWGGTSRGERIKMREARRSVHTTTATDPAMP